MDVGKRIRERRKELNLSVDELAKKLNKNRTTVYRYEKGDIENLPMDILGPLIDTNDSTAIHFEIKRRGPVEMTEPLSLLQTNRR